MKNFHKYQNNTIKYVKEKIQTLNLTILLGIIIVLFIVLKFSYQFLNYVPSGSVSVLLLMLATLTGIIYALSRVTTSRAINAIESYSSKLNTLLSTSRDVHRIDYSDVLIGKIIESAVSLTNADGAALMITSGNNILIKTAKGVVDKQLENMPFLQSNGIAERVIRNGEKINIADIKKTNLYISDMDHKIIKDANSLLCIPLSVDGRQIGALELIKRKEEIFSEEDEELLQYFVEQSAHAMKKNILCEDSKNFEIHLTNILIEAIDLITGNKGHLKRTVKYAMLIGQKAGMSKDDLQTLYRAAMLHDIGFLKIHLDEISSVEQYNAHAFLGFKILEQITFYRDLAYPVLYHHERYDGTGYPKGLSGEAIPLISRIISIAEVFDVMTNRKTHESKARKAEDDITRNEMRFDTAISELKKNAGTQFDPRLVDIFIKNISEDDLEIDKTIPNSATMGDYASGKEYSIKYTEN